MACSPGVSPVALTVMVTLPAAAEKVASPLTVLPLRASMVAAARVAVVGVAACRAARLAPTAATSAAIGSMRVVSVMN